MEQWVAQTAAETNPDVGQQGSSGDPIIIHSPNAAQRLILNQQAQLEEMRRHWEPPRRLCVAASVSPTWRNRR